MKRPSFQFYPWDWMNDLNLRQCSPEARSLWIDLMCIMHDGEPYGHLSTAAGPISLGWVANRSGMSLRNVRKCLVELETISVFSKDERGIIFSRRMVRDEMLREKRATWGALSANNPNVPREKKDIPQDEVYGPPNETTEGGPYHPSLGGSPSSSSSSSSSKDIYTPTEQKPAASKKIRKLPDPEIVATARRLCHRHPEVRSCTESIAVHLLERIVTRHKSGSFSQTAILAMVDGNHEQMCNSRQWQERDGEFARGLRNWLAPSDDEYMTCNGRPTGAPGTTPGVLNLANLPGHMNPGLLYDWPDENQVNEAKRRNGL